jgi:predicted nucleic acid-binding protein
MTLVVDASVVLKWLLRDQANERDTERATELMQSILDGSESVLQPVHWLLEVAAVLARLSPRTAERDLALLQALELPIDESPEVLSRACGLAIETEQHLFDTLYHAVALQRPDALLVTADEKYLAAGAPLGQVTRLGTWQPQPGA